MAKSIKVKVAPSTGVSNKNINVAQEPPKSVSVQGFPDMPLYVPQGETNANIRLVDNRTINPATGLPIPKNKMGAKTLSVNPRIIQTIVAHAKAKGIDPYDALAIPYQESGFGASGTGLGENKDYFPDEGIGDNFDDIDEANMNMEANAFVKGIADKLNYAKRLGFSNKGKEYAFQAYNGYGKLAPRVGEKTTSFYGIPVSAQNPLDMAKNPVYGKTVLSLRNILVNHPEIRKIVDRTPAFKSVWDQPATTASQPAPKKVMVKISR